MAAKAVRVTRKGQVTIPVDMRKDLGISEGDIVYFTRSERGLEVVTPQELVARTAGIFKEYAEEIGPIAWDRDEIWTEIAKERYERTLAASSSPDNDHPRRHNDHD